MTGEGHMKILVGVDGSDRAFHTVKYLSRIPSVRKAEVILYNVFSEVPDSYWDMDGGSQLFTRKGALRAWEAQKRAEAEAYVGHSRQVLLDAGLPENAVVAEVRKREQGIARDLVSEAKRGYAAVAVGRRGVSRLRAMVLGSVANKLLEAVSFAPLFLVGRKASPKRVLIAFDGSKNAMRAVGCVAAFLEGSDFRVCLMHVIRGSDAGYTRAVEKRIAARFKEAEGRLRRSGFARDQVSVKTVAGQESRAGAIVAEAKEEGYGTIVVGRRGLTRVESFFMGRVSTKVVHLARGLATWVVG